MEDPNWEEWRIKEFRPPDENSGTLRRIWNNGLSIGKKIALTGIVVSAMPLALPPLVVLSAFGVAFTVPFGFYFASYAATDKIMSILLSYHKRPMLPPPLLRYEDALSDDDEAEKPYECNDDKVDEGEGRGEQDDLEEEEKVWEDDARQAINSRIELDEEENNEIQDDSEFAGDVGIDEDENNVGDVMVDKFEQDGYEEDVGECTEVEEPVPIMVSEISSMEEGGGEMLGNGTEMDVLSSDVGGENVIDVEQVEVEDVFGPQVSMEESKSMVKFGDVELQELERETPGMIDSIRDEGVGENEKNLELSSEKIEPIPSTTSEIMMGIREAEEEISSMKDEEKELLGNGLEATIVSAEVGGEKDMDVGKIEQVDVFGPQVLSMEESCRKVKFGDVEPEELERETTGMIESIKDEGIVETKDHEQSMEKVSPDESIRDDDCVQQVFVPYVQLQKNDSEPLEGIFGGLETVESKIENQDGKANLQLAVEKKSPISTVAHAEELSIVDEVEQSESPSKKETLNAIAGLEELSEPVSVSQDTARDDNAVLLEKEIEDTRRDPTMFVVPEELEPVRGFTRNDEDPQGVSISGKQMEEIGLNLNGEEGETPVVDKDHVHVRELVVHVKKPGININEETEHDPNSRGGTLIIMRAEAKTGIESELNQVQDCRRPRGTNLNCGEIQDSNLQDRELPSISASKPIEGLVNEFSLWKQINAMRTIVGYEAPPHASCAEELKALYVFTGVEPPPSFSEPLSIADVNEKLLFLMAVVGVRE